MRRLVPIAAFALFLAVPLWAQHGGGHGGGGGHAGGSGGHSSFSGGHSGFSGSHMSGGGHVSSGMRSGSGPSYSRPSSRPFSRPFSPPQYQRGLNEEMLSQRRLSPRNLSQRAFSRPPLIRNRFRGNRFQTFGFRNGCFGFPCRGYYYPWAYGAYYDPFWWEDSDSSYDEDYDHDRAIAEDMNQQSLEEQQTMRQEEADGDQDLYARASRPAPRETEGAPILPNTVLVFRDQHQQEIRNYAIVGQTLWNFDPQHTEKIPMSDLDLPATAKANDDRGLTFRVPDSGQAQ